MRPFLFPASARPAVTVPPAQQTPEPTSDQQPQSPRRAGRRLLAAAVVVVVLLGAAAFADWWICYPEQVTKRYLGRKRCAECHQRQLAQWQGSDHDRAMEPATPETVLGNFDGTTFRYGGVEHRFFRREGKFFVTTENAQGKLQTFQVSHTFGWRPLQQYLVSFDDGRKQVLPFCWDVEQKRWFHIYQNEQEPVRPGERVHWTGIDQNWNYMCAACHSTNVHKGYNAKTNTYHTTWSEMDVSCEACHGPGSLHVELARSRSLFWDRRHGYGLAKLKGPGNQTQLDACAPCHSRRQVLREGFQPGAELLDYYVPELLDDDLYYEDGQIQEEVYVYGSFLQSLMYRKGVRCSDCHEPHSTSLKFSGNRLCLQCHEPGKYDTTNHHHHHPQGPGGRCVECHMPHRKYMVIDPRRDHSIRVPRPELSLLYRTPNACSQCHYRRKHRLEQRWRDYHHCLDRARAGDQEARAVIDQLDRWAQEAILRWYGPQSAEKRHWTYLLAAARSGRLPESKPESPAASAEESPQARRRERKQIVQGLQRLFKQRELGPLVRASAVALLRQYLDVPKVREINDLALEDAEPLVRRAALSNLEPLYPVRNIQRWSYRELPRAEAEALERTFRRLARRAQKLLQDPVLAVRAEAARVLSIVPPHWIDADYRPALKQALEDYEATQRLLADRPGAHLNLGVLYSNQLRFEEAEAEYRQALKLDPHFVPAMINLALMYNYQRRNAEAERLLRQAVKDAPEFADAAYYLGLLLAEDRTRLEEAAKWLKKATELSPDYARAYYNLGLALQALGRWSEALQALKEAQRLEPENLDFLNALVHYHLQRGQWAEALEYLDQMARLLPGNPEIQRMLQQVRRRARTGAGP